MDTTYTMKSKTRTLLNRISSLGLELALMDEHALSSGAKGIMENIAYLRDELAAAFRENEIDNKRYLVYDVHLERYYFWVCEKRMRSE